MATYTTLRRGSSGDEVIKLQTALKNAGYSIDVDGKYGPQTESITKEYQKANGLSVDGIAGNQTLGKLYGGSTTTAPSATTPSPTQTNNSFEYKNFEYPDINESETVKQADAMLQQFMANNKGSAWTDLLNDKVNEINNYGPFSYDLNSDALYQQYKDQYITQGQMAMMDTMGQAQAMTGGYGNSYAQTVGQQTYQGYLQQLNDKVPELYQLALNQYIQGKDDLYNQASLFATMEQNDMDKYYKELDYLTGRADTAYDREAADRDFAAGLWADEQKYNFDISENTKNDAYDRATMLLGLGVMPEAETLAQAGISAAEAQAVVNKVKDNEKKAASSGNDGSGSSGNGYDNGGQTTSDIKKMQAELGIAADGKWGPASVEASGGLTADEAYTAWKNGTLGEDTGGYTYEETPAVKSFNAKIRTKHEFARGTNDDNTKYKTYKEYVKGMLEKYEGDLTDDEIATICHQYGL